MKTGRLSVTPLILAGGASSRMGTPKALLQFQGMTFLDRLIELCRQDGQEVVVVLGFHHQVIRAGVHSQARFVTNPRPELGQLSSLQCGLAEIAGTAMFLPVDLPAISQSTVRAVVDAFQANEPLIAAPTYLGRHGHPVCVSRRVIDEILALPAAGQARDVIRKYRQETAFVEVDDAAILHDIDTPLEYRNLVGAGE